jgi:hypothetical protein
MTSGETPDDQGAAEQALAARIAASKARIEHLAALTQWMQARWSFLEAEERRRDSAASAEVIDGRVRARIEPELKERGLDQA